MNVSVKCVSESSLTASSLRLTKIYILISHPNVHTLAQTHMHRHLDHLSQPDQHPNIFADILGNKSVHILESNCNLITVNVLINTPL